jgi:Ca2+:H+ antiporter
MQREKEVGIMTRWLYALLVFAVLATALSFLHVAVPPVLLFIIAGLGILPLAALIGQSVEQVAEHTGEAVGGLLFATFGNATELIIGLFALSEGLVDVVKASIIGSILGNVLLVLGLATCVGTFKYGRLHFEVRPASQYASLLTLCLGGLFLPAVAELLASRSGQAQIFERGVVLSDYIAVVLLLGYFASILFSVFHVGDRKEEGEEIEPLLGARSQDAIARLLSYRQDVAHSAHPHKSGVLRQIDSTVDAIVAHESVESGQAQVPPHAVTSGTQTTQATEATQASQTSQTSAVPTKAVPRETPVQQGTGAAEKHKPNLWRALLLLVVATAGVAIVSDILVGTIEPFTKTLGWNPAFVGLVFVPLIGGLPEYFNTINMALDKRMGMVLAASAGSSIQIALLVAPLLVIFSLLAPQRLDLIFSVVEIGVLALAAFLFSEITRDGELVWLEGLLLVLLYTMMAATVFVFGA